MVTHPVKCTLKQLQELLRRHRLLLLAAGRSSLPGVAEAVAGGAIRGSWWGHPEGNAIFNLVNELADWEETLTCKLISGKQTFVHRELWPALWRAATGEVEERLPDSPEARALLAKVRKAGAARPSPQERAAARELEAALVVATRSIHTESGRHETELVGWNELIPTPCRDGGAKLSAGEARFALFAAAFDASGSVPRKEAERWFPWGPRMASEAIERLIAEKRLRVTTVGRSVTLSRPDAEK